ncbi:MAG TPA: hypothetical protein VII49_09255 [Rhizomicrobium sp.]
MLLSSLGQSAQTPTASSTAPGYTTLNPTGDTAFPFRLYTDLISGTSSGSVRVQVNGSSGATVNEITDGWILHR